MILFCYLYFVAFCDGYIKKNLHSFLMAIIIIWVKFRYIYKSHEGE
ncbi:hypothetical protein GRPL_01527 [Raoultella planticola ATCC 33531]|nr:hypothetical protein GRPL_01527 [Raoultella planticola ATCC 33531]